jgi:transposase
VVTIGEVSRFQRGKQVASYLGLIPSERSSGSKRRMGAISKQGNLFLRTMLVEAAQSAVRHDEQFRKEYRHRCHHKPTGVAKVAAARGPRRAVFARWGEGAQAGDTVVLDAAHPDAVSADRSQRGQPESSCGRRELDRSLEWAPSHSAQAGCSQ